MKTRHSLGASISDEDGQRHAPHKSKSKHVRFAPGGLDTSDGHPEHEGKQEAPAASTSTSGFSPVKRAWGDDVTHLTKRNIGEVIAALRGDPQGDNSYHASIVRLRRRVDLPSESPADDQSRPANATLPPPASKGRRNKRPTKELSSIEPAAVADFSETSQRRAKKRKR